MRRRSAAWPELRVLAARVERVAAEADREHLERQLVIHVDEILRGAALLHEVEDLRGRGGEDVPRLVEVRRVDRILRRARREERRPKTQRERARASLERVQRGRAMPERRRPCLRATFGGRGGGPERDTPRLLERHRERAREPRRARVGLLVVVLRGDAHEVLEPELDVERIALGAVDRVGHGDDLEPAPSLVERGGARGARGLAERAERLVDVGVAHPAPPERREPASERARRDRVLLRQDALREPTPEILALEIEVRRRRGDRAEHPAVLFLRGDDRGELTGEDAEALGGHRRERGERALPEERVVAEDPVEHGALELLHRSREAAERARRVHPHERLRVEQERLERLERPPEELGVRRRRHAHRRDLEAPRGEHATAERAVRGIADHRVERALRSPDPFPERRDLERARAGFPHEDLEARARLGVLGREEARAVAEQRRARDRVEQRPLDHALPRDLPHALSERLARRGRGEHRRHRDVAPPRVVLAPRQECVGVRAIEHRDEGRGVRLLERCLDRSSRHRSASLQEKCPVQAAGAGSASRSTPVAGFAASPAPAGSCAPRFLCSRPMSTAQPSHAAARTTLIAAKRVVDQPCLVP